MKKFNLSLIFLLSGILLPLPFEINTANAHGWDSQKKAMKKTKSALVEKNGKWYHRSCKMNYMARMHYHDANGKKKGGC